MSSSQPMQCAMRSIRAPLRRIPPQRPLRPPNHLQARLMSITRAVRAQGYNAPRAQLPFLSSSRIFRNGTRTVTTETRLRMIYRIRLGIYWISIAMVILLASLLGQFMFRQDWLDRLYPCPNDWSFDARVNWREGQEELSKEKDGSAMANWGGVGTYFRRVIDFCERKGGDNGSPVPLNIDVDDTIPGLDKDLIKREPLSDVNNFSRIGMDVSEKPEHWRRAYFRALMGFARATEMNDGWVVDVKRHLSFPGDQVVGPSNPYPHPVWPGSPPAPLEQDCRPCFDKPQTLYLRILTTKGFSARQRLEAGLAYAAWMDYEGDKELSLQIHQWSLNLATIALADEGTDPSTIVDTRTGIIKSSAPFVTPNILKATTALAFHHARNRELSTALNIYISVLRARRAAPEAPPQQQYKPLPPDYSLQTTDSLVRYVRTLTSKPQMAPEPPSGNQPFVRTQGSNCAEAGVMAHVGEILYATSSMRDGLSWTRDAVALAEDGFTDARLDPESKVVCGDCMSAGLDNWHRMIGVLVAEESKRRREEKAGRKSDGWFMWVPGFGKSEAEKLVDEGDWRQEAELVDNKRAQFMEHRLLASMNRKARFIPLD